MDKLLTVCQAAEYLQLHTQTLYKKREIPRARIGGSVRFKKSDLEKYVEQNTINPLPFHQPLLNSRPFNLKIPSEHGMDYSGGKNGMAKAKSQSRLNIGIGAVYPRKFKCGVRWFMDYRDKNGKRIQRVIKHAQNQQDALKALQEEIRRVFDDEYNLKRERGSMKFESLAEEYLELHAKVNKRGWKKADKVYLDCHLIPYFRGYEIAEIDPRLIEKYKKKRLEEGAKKSTVNRESSCLRLIFQKAIGWGYLTENPMKGLKPFSEKDNYMERVLSLEEEKRLLENCASKPVKDFIVFGLNTGMRMGEILSLEWKNVSLEKRAILVTMTKSGKNREIPINDTLYSLLDRLHNGNGSERMFPYTNVYWSFKKAARWKW
jgi:excisionase family DNA binding protein